MSDDPARDVDFSTRLETFAVEIRQAARAIVQSRGFTFLAVFTIAIGVGSFASMYGVVRNLVLAPPAHVTAPGDVFRLHEAFPHQDGREEVFMGTSYPFFLLVSRSTSIDSAAGYQSADVPVGNRQAGHMAHAMMVSRGFWRVMGTSPALGRFIDDPEADPVSGARVVVLGHGYWRRQFAGDPQVIGKPLTIKQQPYTIIGVAPRGFRGVEFGDVDLWLPLFAQGDGSEKAVTWHIPKTSFGMLIAVRLRSRAQAPQVAAELTALYRSFLVDAYGPGTFAADLALLQRNRQARVMLGPVTGGLGGDLQLLPEARIAVWLAGLSVMLLVVACSNLSGLLLLRSVARRSDAAIRLALGIGRRRLALQLLTEGFLLSLLGGVAGIGVAALIGVWVEGTLLAGMSSGFVDVTDPRVLGLAVLCAWAITSAASLAPLWHARQGSDTLLRHTAARATARRPYVLTTLLATQGALTVVLLVGAGLVLKSLHKATTEDIGLDRDAVVVQVDFTGSGRPPAVVASFFEQALERVRTTPGVAAASLATNAPLRSVRATGSLRIPGRTDQPTLATGGPYVNAVSPAFFATTGMRMREGRDFTAQERMDGALIVNETMAKTFFPDESAVGKCLLRGRPEVCVPIVGVVADARRFNLVEDERYLQYYVALAPTNLLSRVLFVRKAPGAKSVETSIRRLLVDLDSTLPHIDIEPMGQALEPQMRRWRLAASIFTTFGFLAIVLALIGLFSSVSYHVSQRRREFATRLAIGATRAALVRMMLRDGLREAALIVIAGLGLAAWAVSFSESLLFHVSPRDPVVFGGVAAAVLVLATSAALWPAVSVSRIDPATVLRAEV